MSPILFFTPNSCAFGSIVALEWLGKPYRLCRIEAAMHASPAYRRLSPLGEVPALMHEDQILTESMAILHHLGSRDLSRGLVPSQGTPEFDRLNQVLSYLTTSVHPLFQPIFHADRFADAAEDQEKVRQKAVSNLPGRYERLEAFLQGRDWLVGDRPTVADAYLYGIVRWGDGFIDTNRYEAVRRLRERLATDPAVKFAHAVERQQPAVSAGPFEGNVDFTQVENLAKAA